ncbi:hypothetical protein NO932_11835 [Pelagibacterium sp. 26DY04]|uniref:hypothetical protein n=1 Tax=Pelagibacterium sp. 26DY04 TaxID=2967130 RepID=UPI00281557B8|nr:hypothetical protein [Pelagibacterium sp. 26DY04]WMT85619.1 hypothetical protein NO932_11835 [Pelagibacterium sp. 26DY04]
MASNNPLFGHNNPMHHQGAKWDGHRSIRFGSGEGLATVAYSYLLSDAEMWDAAERISLLWNLHVGESNDDLRAALKERSNEA